jgi:hypothetical protein
MYLFLFVSYLEYCSLSGHEADRDIGIQDDLLAAERETGESAAAGQTAK